MRPGEGSPGGHQGEPTGEQLDERTATGTAGALAFSSFKVASGKGGKSKGEKVAFIDKIFDWPAGELLVALVGLGIVAIAIRFGQIGWPALGVAYGIIGLLLVYSAISYDPEKATGMDTALKTLAGQPYGSVLLLTVAAGLACFGAYCLFDARYRRA